MNRNGVILLVLLAIAVAFAGYNYNKCKALEAKVLSPAVVAVKASETVPTPTVNKMSKDATVATPVKVVAPVAEVSVPTLVVEPVTPLTPVLVTVAKEESMAHELNEARVRVAKAEALVAKAKADLIMATRRPPSVQAVAVGAFNSGGGASASENLQNNGSIGGMASAPSVVVDDNRIPNSDLPPQMVDGERFLTPRCGGGMGPQILSPGALVTFDGERVRITGVKLMKVEVYTPHRRTLNGVSEFSAVKGERFSVTFKCAKGHEHFSKQKGYNLPITEVFSEFSNFLVTFVC